MKRSFTLSSLLLTAATANTSAQSAEFASADCVTGLNEIGLISVTNLSGSQQDVEHAIARKADEQGASWYRIIQMYEEQQPDSWARAGHSLRLRRLAPAPHSPQQQVVEGRRVKTYAAAGVEHHPAPGFGQRRRSMAQHLRPRAKTIDQPGNLSPLLFGGSFQQLLQLTPCAVEMAVSVLSPPHTPRPAAPSPPAAC
ncbi:membrane protein [Klebsiella pneumoniae]|nr:membrane protein [Klebsiella pneumoniae]